MLKSLFLFLFLTSLCVLSTHAQNDCPYVENHFIKKNYSEIKEHLFISKYELSNKEYKDFLNALASRNETEMLKKCTPDTLCWRNEFAYNEPYVNYYFQSPAFINYPVVGVTYEDALAYCNWLTSSYNKNKKSRFKKVVFRLPTSEEWTYAANCGDNTRTYPWGSGFIQNNRKQDLCYYKHQDLIYDSSQKKYIINPNQTTDRLNQRVAIVGNVKAFFPNNFGLYNMSGNAAEMVSEKGIAKGGSFADPAWEVRIDSKKNYDHPSAQIGFRVAMEVIEE